MNNFEKHLREHKKDYQLQEVNPKIWEGIKSAQAKQKPSVLRRLKPWQVAATVLLVLTGTFLLWQQPAPNLSASLLQEYGFDASQPKLVARAVANELAATPVPKLYQEDYLNMMAALKALDTRYAPVLKELDQEDVSEFTERQALNYYRRKVDLMTGLIRELTILKNNEKRYAKDETDYEPAI